MATLTNPPWPATSYIDPDPGVYDESEESVTYHDDEMCTVLAATVSGALNVKVTLANPGKYVVCSWSYSKAGGPPRTPPRSSGDPNLVLIDATVKPSGLELLADGFTVMHKVAGVYTYAALDPSKVDARNPVPPWLRPRDADLAVALAGTVAQTTGVVSTPTAPVFTALA